MYGLCSYPISSKKWICSLLWNSAAAMLCTGASPQRYQPHVSPSPRGDPFARNIAAHLVVEPALAVEEVEELRVRLAPPEVHVRDLEVAPDCMRSVSSMHTVIRKDSDVYAQWHRLYEFPPSSDMYPIALSRATVSGCSRMNSFTLSHSVGIVARNSYIVIVNAARPPRQCQTHSTPEHWHHAPYVLLWSSMNRNGSKSMSHRKCTSGSTRQYHLYCCSSGCL